MDIGRKIYYEKTNGIVIWDKGEMSGSVIETTLEEDKQSVPILAAINPDQLGVLQLNHGDFFNEFQNCRGYLINPATEEIIFL